MALTCDEISAAVAPTTIEQLRSRITSLTVQRDAMLGALEYADKIIDGKIKPKSKKVLRQMIKDTIIAVRSTP